MARDRVRRAAIAAMAVGAAILLVSGLLALSNSGEDEPNVVSPDIVLPRDSSPVEDDPATAPEPSPSAKDDRPALIPGRDEPGLKPANGDFFGNGSVETGPHEVTITVESDGPIFVGYEFWKAGKGRKTADKKFTITKTVKRNRTVAQVGAQVMKGATYASCTITVDDVIVNTARVTKELNVVVCAG